MKYEMSNDITPDILPIPACLLDAPAIAGLASDRPGSSAARATLTAKADSLLTARPESVMDKEAAPPSGDKHDYSSLGVYFWPNPDTPDGLPYIYKDGRVNPELHCYDLPRMRRMATRAETLALAALYTGEVACGNKAAELIRVWFLDEATRMNPHLNYAKFVPGESEGRSYGVLDTVDLLRVANAVRILEWIPGLAYADGPQIRQWFQQYAAWMTTSELGRTEAAASNNHRVWYVAQLAGILMFCDNADAARDLLETAVPDILATQMDADGTLPEELGRTRSFHYVSFALTPLLICAEAGKGLGLDLTAPVDGRSVGKGVEWFAPYLTGKLEWAWEQIYEENPYEDAYPLLRLAANALGEPAYEAALSDLAGPEYGDLLLNLVMPPR